MNARLLCLLTLLLGTAPLARADYELQRTSRFDAAQVPRNIFWPIGYVHVENAPTQPTAFAPRPSAPLLTVDQFAVSSILISGGLPLAIINGQPRGVGEFLLVGGVSVQVVAITDGLVTLRYNKTDVRVPLKH